MIIANRIFMIVGLGICVIGIVMDNVLMMLGGAFLGLGAMVNSFRR